METHEYDRRWKACDTLSYVERAMMSGLDDLLRSEPPLA